MDAIRFPGETNEYRKARDELLKAERDLRRRTEELAQQRRALPLGGKVAEDYAFAESESKSVRLSELFGGKDSLLVYHFMFSAEMKHACPMCTAFLDGLDGQALHIGQRTALVIVAKSPIARITEHAHARGWKNMRLLSCAETTFNRDYHGENEDGQESMMNVFTRRDGATFHTYGTEMHDSEPGQNSRHLDTMWPLWTAFDLTPEGRGATWYPKLAY